MKIRQYEVSRTLRIVALVAACQLAVSACGGSGDNETSDGGDTSTTSAGNKDSKDAEETAAFDLPVSTEEGNYTLTVTEVIDPAKASAPWGSTDDRYIAIEAEVAGASTLPVAPMSSASCFTLRDAEGTEADLAVGLTTEGATAIDGTKPPKGQVVFKPEEDFTPATLSYNCTGAERSEVTVELSPAS